MTIGPDEYSYWLLEEMAHSLGTHYPGDWQTTLRETARAIAGEEPALENVGDVSNYIYWLYGLGFKLAAQGRLPIPGGGGGGSAPGGAGAALWDQALWDQAKWG